jgi:hypothetical protein
LLGEIELGKFKKIEKTRHEVAHEGKILRDGKLPLETCELARALLFADIKRHSSERGRNTSLPTHMHSHGNAEFSRASWRLRR